MNSFKPGDWVRYKGITQISHITHTGYHLSNGYITKGDNEEMKLWKPKAGEWVVIADDITPDLYAVFQFNNHSRDRQILPLAFLQTLKDQS